MFLNSIYKNLLKTIETPYLPRFISSFRSYWWKYELQLWFANIHHKLAPVYSFALGHLAAGPLAPNSCYSKFRHSFYNDAGIEKKND